MSHKTISMHVRFSPEELALLAEVLPVLAAEAPGHRVTRAGAIRTLVIEGCLRRAGAVRALRESAEGRDDDA